MESEPRWQEEFDTLMELRVFFERQTRRSVSIEILDFIDQSRRAGRSEHFLSGLLAAYSLVVGKDSDAQVSLYEDQLELPF